MPKATKGGTRKVGEKFASKWVQRIAAARRTQDSWKREGQLNYGLYYNDPRAWRRCITIKGYKQPLVMFNNPVALNVDNDRDRMLPKNPTFKVTPRKRWVEFQTEDGQPAKRDNVLAARVYKEVANMIALELDLQRIIKRAATDSLVTNLGVVKVAWDEIGGLNASSAIVTSDETKSVLGGGEVGESPIHQSARPHFPWVVQVPWDRIILDPMAGSVDQITWIAERIVVPKASTDKPKKKREEDGLSSLTNVDKGNEDDENDYSLRQDEGYSPDVEMEEKWEVHYKEASDEDESGFCYYTFDLYLSDGGSVRNHRKYPKDIGGFVYEFLQFKEINGDLLGFSQIRYYASAAAHENLSKQIMLDSAIRALPFLLVDSQIGKAALDAMTEGGAGKIVPVNQGIPKDRVFPVIMPSAAQEQLVVSQVARSSSEQMSGRSINDQLQGGMKTATEAKVVDRNSGEVMQAGVEVLRKFAGRVIRKCVRVFTHLMDPEQKYEIPDSKGGFFTFEIQNLICDVAIELDWQSTVRKDDAVERKLNMDLLSILAPLSAQMPDLNLKPVVQKIAIGSGYDDPDEIFMTEEPAIPPAEVRMMILSGDQLIPEQTPSIAEDLKNHIDFLTVALTDPEMNQLWAGQPGAIQRLADYVSAMTGIVEKAGLAEQAGLSIGGSGGGSGAQHGRPSQGVVSDGDQAAALSRSSNIGGTGGGRMANV